VAPARRTALVSVLAAAGLVALKLIVGLATHSLGLLSEAAHSGTDLIAALLTFFAIGVARRPADRGHQYGHGRAEHLAALGEATFLVGASLIIVYRALTHIFDTTADRVNPTWYALVTIAGVILIDLGRTVVSLRAAGRYKSAALQASAFHFGSDLFGSTAVLVGLVLARAGYRDADSFAALFVAVLVFAAAFRLMRRNVDVLMDRAPADALEAARQAIEALDPPVELRRLRMRQAAARHFADVVIGVPAEVAVGQGHAAADAVEEAVKRALPEADVVVHVEPEDSELAARGVVQAAATRVTWVREVHNVQVVQVGDATQVSLHLKLPGGLTLVDAHAIASEVEAAIKEALPDADSVYIHLEPLAEEAEGRSPPEGAVERDRASVERIVRERTGGPPRALSFLETEGGLVAYLTLGLDPKSALTDAHARASEIEEEILRERPGISDVVVHTEP
jgi:cation diffusion facilitator family transporter